MSASREIATQNLINGAAAAPRCQHVRLNGQTCGSPARSGSTWCFFHAGDYEGRLPVTGVPEDAATVQIEIARVIRALQSSAIEPRAAGLILYGLQIASQNLKRLGAEMPTVEMMEEMEETKRARRSAEGEDEEEAFPQKSQDLGYYIYERLKAPPERRDLALSLCVQLAGFVRGEEPAPPWPGSAVATVPRAAKPPAEAE